MASSKKRDSQRMARVEPPPPVERAPSLLGSFPAHAQPLASGGVLQQPVIVPYAEGLHMRPATLLSELAKQFDAQATLIRGDVRADLTSVLDLFMLCAEKGTELILEVKGPEAEKALQALTQLLAQDLASDRPPPKG